jgi:hypothetical protein
MSKLINTKNQPTLPSATHYKSSQRYSILDSL